ncbi:MAG: cysteine--tRNA ligase [Patescibacteria group bacterium]|nr:cysteine--tRNA ligase [Patescibacteria group bacterium]
MVKIFNTMSGAKEDLPHKDELHLFVCGPTVYDFSHLGHARTYLAFDIITRYLRSRGKKVEYLQNITDIDDKIIERSKTQKISWKRLARDFEKAYKADMKSLGITAVSIYARATDFIPEIVAQVRTLIAKKNAYEIPGDGWYFDLTTFPDYGKLSHRTAAQANDSMSRIDASDKKRNAGDFCLWKFSKKDEPSWKTELGTGRPGWHIEDTAISEKFFGPQYDLHGGAVDLKFPHHEAEIAQQESASGKKPFVRIWMHAGFLLINGEKMSKSLGNFTTIRDFLNRHNADTLRMMIASHHYRSPINYTDELAEQAKASLQRIAHFRARLRLIRKAGTISPLVENGILQAKEKFTKSMDDDFNTPDALAALFELMNSLETSFWNLTRPEARALEAFYEEMLALLGFSAQKAPSVPREIAQKAKEREAFRIHKQFIQSDAIRKELDALGYSIEDTPAGPLVLRK